MECNFALSRKMSHVILFAPWEKQLQNGENDGVATAGISSIMESYYFCSLTGTVVHVTYFFLVLNYVHEEFSRQLHIFWPQQRSLASIKEAAFCIQHAERARGSFKKVLVHV